jgi:pyruvate-formate lyase-activating enzyme
VVPGHTDAETNLRGIAQWLRGIGGDGIELLPYHPMGEVKALRLGVPLAPLGVSATAGAAARDRAATILRSAGIKILTD